MEGHHEDLDHDNDPEEEEVPSPSSTTSTSRVNRSRRRSVLRSSLVTTTTVTPEEEEQHTREEEEEEEDHPDVDLADLFEEEDLFFQGGGRRDDEESDASSTTTMTSPFLSSRTVVYTTVRNLPRRQIVLSSIYNLVVDSLFDTDVFQQTLQESLDTYSNELFRKTTHLRLADSLSPVVLSKEALASMEDPVCRICLETFVETQVVVDLDCRHTYHQQCLLDAVSHQHSRCPLCRATIPITERTLLMDCQNTEGHHITLYH